MLGGGFMGQMHQTNKQNREMLKKNKKDQKQPFGIAQTLFGVERQNEESYLTTEQQTIIKKEIEAGKRKEKILSISIIFGSIALAVLLVLIFMY